MAGRIAVGLACVLALLGCPPAKAPQKPASDIAQARAASRQMIAIAAGDAIFGSTKSERQTAYATYERTAGHNAAKRGKWFEQEAPRHRKSFHAFVIDQKPVTNLAYAEFVRDTDRYWPRISEHDWRRQGFAQDYDSQVKRYNWTGPVAPKGRELHPVVLVSWHDAKDYCQWRGTVAGRTARLPTAEEYERAARGPNGNNYPWGPSFDPSKLNSGVTEPLDTTPVGRFPEGQSPEGVLDAAGNVFQWTSSPWNEQEKAVKGSSWEDYGGLGRGASIHGRAANAKHVIVGFRCAADV